MFDSQILLQHLVAEMDLYLLAQQAHPKSPPETPQVRFTHSQIRRSFNIDRRGKQPHLFRSLALEARMARPSSTSLKDPNTREEILSPALIRHDHPFCSKPRTEHSRSNESGKQGVPDLDQVKTEFAVLRVKFIV